MDLSRTRIRGRGGRRKDEDNEEDTDSQEKKMKNNMTHVLRTCRVHLYIQYDMMTLIVFFFFLFSFFPFKITFCVWASIYATLR